MEKGMENVLIKCEWSMFTLSAKTISGKKSTFQHLQGAFETVASYSNILKNNYLRKLSVKLSTYQHPLLLIFVIYFILLY